MDKQEKKVYCSIHNERPVNYLRIHEEDSNIFKCSHCIVQGEIPSEELISLSQILESNEDTIIRNWPPLEDINLIEQIEQEIKIGQKITQEINGIFDNFERDIIESLQKLKKSVLRKVEEKEISSIDSLAFKRYHEIAEISKLKEALNTLNEGDNSNTKLNELFQAAIKNKNTNMEAFVQLLKQLKEKDSIMDFSLLYAQRELILSMIDSWQSQELVKSDEIQGENPTINLKLMSILNSLMNKSKDINLKTIDFERLEQIKRIEDMDTLEGQTENSHQIQELVNFKSIPFKKYLLNNYASEKEITRKSYTDYLSSCNQIIATISKLDSNLIQQIESLIVLIHNNHINKKNLLSDSSTIFS